MRKTIEIDEKTSVTFGCAPAVVSMDGCRLTAECIQDRHTRNGQREQNRRRDAGLVGRGLPPHLCVSRPCTLP